MASMSSSNLHLCQKRTTTTLSDDYTEMCQKREAFIKGEDIWNKKASCPVKEAADQTIEDLKKDLMAKQNSSESLQRYCSSSKTKLPSCHPLQGMHHQDLRQSVRPFSVKAMTLNNSMDASNLLLLWKRWTH
ncbi:hypothetical protein CRENBAI_007363 [Crenichthys baileyi]|uniref:Uncharacterized protein n=1 Tax=Crenichthys baileyi TaxID=28760 RepID=A0AAV9QMU4_9TELE